MASLSGSLLAVALAVLIAGACASTRVSKITEEFVAKPNGQVTTAKAVLVLGKEEGGGVLDEGLGEKKGSGSGVVGEGAGMVRRAQARGVEKREWLLSAQHSEDGHPKMNPVLVRFLFFHLLAYFSSMLPFSLFCVFPQNVSSPCAPPPSQPGDRGKDVTCSFTFATVGGTNEQWTITLERVGRKHICMVER